MSQEVSVLQSWGALAIAAAGTYACRAVGVMVSEKIQQDSEFFRWLSAVTYALVAALVVRMVLLPIGPLATVPVSLRLGFCGVSWLVMVAGTRRRPGLALLSGVLMMLAYGSVIH
jgi:branched-subunit amino acid transport protein